MADRVLQIGSTCTITTIVNWLSVTAGSSFTTEGEVGELLDTYYTEGVIDFNATGTPTTTYFRTLRPHADNRYDPYADTGARIVVNTAANGIRLREDYARLEGFRIVQQGLGTYVTINGGQNHWLDSLYLYADVESGEQSALRCGRPNPTVTNCIVEGNNSTETLSSAGIELAYGSGTGSVYNCIVKNWTRAGGNGKGLKAQFSRVTFMENNYVAGCDQNYVFADSTHDYNATDNNETSGEGNGLTTQTVTDCFTDWANGDFSLKAGSNLIDAGNDLSGVFSVDYNGDTRTGTWDMGAIMETVAAGNTYTIENVDDVYVTEGGFESGVIPPTEGGEDSMVLGASGGNTPGVDDIAILIEGMRIAEGTY